MSYLLNQEVPCTYCRFPNEVEVWSIVNVKDDPELRDLILGGEINMAECQSCHKVFYAEDFILYHDPDAELMAFVYPYAARESRAEFEEKTRHDFAESQRNRVEGPPLSYGPVTLFGMDELVRLIEDEEEMAIQGEIVSALAQERGLSLKKLRPSVARRQQLPTVLPLYDDGSPLRDSVLKAIAEIEKMNDRLTVYSDAHKRLVQDHTAEIKID